MSSFYGPKAQAWFAAAAAEEKAERAAAMKEQEERNTVIVQERKRNLPVADPASLALLSPTALRDLKERGIVPRGVVRVDPSSKEELPLFSQLIELVAAQQFGIKLCVSNQGLAFSFAEEFPQDKFQKFPYIFLRPEDMLTVRPDRAHAATGYISPGVRATLIAKGIAEPLIDQTVIRAFKAVTNLDDLDKIEARLWGDSKQLPLVHEIPSWNEPRLGLMVGMRLAVPASTVDGQFYRDAMRLVMEHLLLRGSKPLLKPMNNPNNVLEYFYTIFDNSYVLFLRWTTLDIVTNVLHLATHAPYNPTNLNECQRYDLMARVIQNEVQPPTPPDSSSSSSSYNKADDDKDSVDFASLLSAQ